MRIAGFGCGDGFPNWSAAIASEISGTARNPDTVVDLSLSPSDPDMQAVIAKFNVLLAALRW